MLWSILAGLLEGTDQLRHSGGIVQGGEGVQVAFVGSLRNLSPAVQIAYALTHRQPSQLVLGASFDGPIRTKTGALLESHSMPLRPSSVRLIPLTPPHPTPILA
jgi:hypothetical protein